jgi:chemotaxis protein methyltransferase CheR
MVTFEERNLVADDAFLWPPSSYDIVFCRNVLMYFTPEAMRDVVGRIGQSLVPGGFLFLGHAETLRGVSQSFHLCHTHDTFYYQRREASEVSGATRANATYADASSTTAVASPIDIGTSWIEAIQRASERIALLASAPRHCGEPVLATTAAAAPASRASDFGLVLEAMRNERFADALMLLSALPAESDSEPEALLLRAVLLANSGKMKEARGACARLLAIDELNAGAHYVMALCHEDGGDAAGAVEHDRTAVYLDAGFAMPRLHMGLIAKRSGDTAGARQELSQALILLAREDASRILLFGGGFSRDALLALCRSELRTAGGDV